MKKEKKFNINLTFEEFELLKIILENSILVNKKHIIDNDLFDLYVPLSLKFGLKHLFFNEKKNEKK